MLIDVSDEQAEALADQASRCRRLADAMYDREPLGPVEHGQGVRGTARDLEQRLGRHLF